MNNEKSFQEWKNISKDKYSKLQKEFIERNGKLHEVDDFILRELSKGASLVAEDLLFNHKVYKKAKGE